MTTYADAERARDAVVPLALAHDDVTSIGISGEPGQYVIQVITQTSAPLRDLPSTVAGVPVIIQAGDRAELHKARRWRLFRKN